MIEKLSMGPLQTPPDQLVTAKEMIIQAGFSQRLFFSWG